MIRPWVANLLLLTAAIAWITNFALSIVRDDYVINESVNSVFLAIVTGLLAARATTKDHDDQDHQDDQDDQDHDNDRGDDQDHERPGKGRHDHV